MSDNLSYRFRTYGEMDGIYQEATSLGKEIEPYMLQYEKMGQLLIFFGSRHSNNPEDPQFEKMDQLWQEFLDHPNPAKQVFNEGGYDRLSEQSTSCGATIRRDTEAGYIRFLAQSAGIPIRSPEPSRKDELAYVQEKGFAEHEVFTYYFARQMLQWRLRESNHEPDEQAYTKKFLEHLNQWQVWNQPYDAQKALGAFKTTTGEVFDSRNVQLLEDLSDPTQSEVSAASSDFRNNTIYQAIEKSWREAKDVFAVFGSGHAIVLEPALERLCEKGD